MDAKARNLRFTSAIGGKIFSRRRLHPDRTDFLKKYKMYRAKETKECRTENFDNLNGIAFLKRI